ncbi:hypothetical protein EZV62_015284 [Acer yangbiense]|uniref:Transposase MuDR plant domain-containing protein n=1 Tax=Acer yangbiense TaxID=1000413 RepID=A0A5C7HUD2_9ROSI|nr:hypothetical protein EZV62_015284 [Acer yangbiense]
MGFGFGGRTEMVWKRRNGDEMEVDKMEETNWRIQQRRPPLRLFRFVDLHFVTSISVLLSLEVDLEPNDLLECMNIDTKRLVIYHGGSWVGNSYEGGLTKWVHVPRGLTYDALVKLVQDVAKVDTARYTIELCSLVSTNIGVARPIIENDNEVSCMMDEDKFIPAVYVTICQKGPTNCVPIDPIVSIDETIHDQENSQALDTDDSDDVLIPNIDTDNSDDVFITNIDTDNSDDGVDDGVGAGSASVSASPSGFATFGEGSFEENGLGEDGSGEHPTPRNWIIPGSERYSLEPNRMDDAISNDGCLYKGKLFRCKKDLKGTVQKYALKENFELRIRRSSKTRYEAGCKDSECEFQLRAYKMQKA